MTHPIQKLFLFATLFFLSAGLPGLPISAARAQGSGQDQPARIEAELEQMKKAASVKSGRLLYRAACADCHGISGNGRGLRAATFSQPATNFTRGVYKFRARTGDLPTTGELARSIREGMPGTEMVPFKALLNEAESVLLAEYLKALSPRFDQADEPSRVLTLPGLPARKAGPDEGAIGRGRALYQQLECGDCHGDSGAGTAGETDDEGRPVLMMDFRDGIYKSGTVDAALYRAIAFGMPGTTMEAYGGTTRPDDLWALVDYLRSMEAAGGLMDWLLGDRPSRFDYRDY